MELTQNADDNSYNAQVIPTVKWILNEKNCLRFDCNEIGFTRENVDAICRIGHSTKAGVTGFVGEKGIGFKSVFKVTSVVWVSSGHYSFKFDKDELLGMVSPIWEPFPEQVEPGYTSFYLKLLDDYDKQGLIDELRSLEPRLLIFLRKLRRIHVEIVGHGAHNLSRTLSREDGDGPGHRIVTLMQDRSILRYVVSKKVVTSLPFESKRLGVSESEIVLAFPINEKDEPYLTPQDVYAFLPIRDYGFQVNMENTFVICSPHQLTSC
jgi:hypothetical protein